MYSIEVVHPGYATWSTSNVRVEAGTCHVQTVTVKANLTPAP